jgi:hypothetical protein
MRVDEEHGDLAAESARQLRVGVHVHDLPGMWLLAQDRLDLPAHLLAEVTTRTGEQAQPDHDAAKDRRRAGEVTADG